MLATQSILSVAFIAVGFTAWWLLRMRSLSSGRSAIVVGVAMWATASAVVWWRSPSAPASSVEFRGRSQLVQSLDSLAWPETTRTPSAAVRAEAPGLQAAPVESLVDGLEARLATQPNDANGWALLAQSYAYTSNDEGAERAVQRAVALGFDERALRERVASAERSQVSGDWFDRVMPTKRP
jgi:cytochrome c-type biogenesis protein CcmH/NrfG